MRNPEEERLADQAEAKLTQEAQDWNAGHRLHGILKDTVYVDPDVQWDIEHVIHDL
jgi:hypothetical protein